LSGCISATEVYFYLYKMDKLKQKVYDYYLQYIMGKIQMLQDILDGLKESGSNETKSTAGDKHETALAMLQIEQSNTREQMRKTLLQKNQMEMINPALGTTVVANGSLVKTDRGYFFMSLALGKAEIDGMFVMAISAQSPLGEKITGLKVGDKVAVNNVVYVIEKIL